MKKFTLILTTATLSLALLTGCGGDKESTADTEAKTESTVEKEAEEYPEGTVFLAPPLDADGNYPEGFDPESYDGVAGQIVEDEEPDKKESKEKKEATPSGSGTAKTKK